MTDPLFADDFVTTLSRDLFGLICGDLIDYGLSRRVYVYEPNPDYVIKFENKGRWFQNVIEWETWSEVKETKYSRWFAPCRMISPCGTVLVQERTTPLPHEKYPKQMP